MLFSVVAPWTFRVLESYFGGSKLVVRKTEPYYMRADNDSIMEKALALMVWGLYRKHHDATGTARY